MNINRTASADLKWDPPALTSPRTSYVMQAEQTLATIHTSWPASRGADITAGDEQLQIRPASILLKNGYILTELHGKILGTFTPESTLFLPHGTFATLEDGEFRLSGGQLADWAWSGKQGDIVSYDISKSLNLLKQPALSIRIPKDDAPATRITMLLGVFLITTFAHPYAGGST